MITVYDFEQRSPEWMDRRRGMVTASLVGRLLSVGPADPIRVDCPKCGAGSNQPCISLIRKEPTPIKVAHDQRVMAAATLPPEISTATGDTFKDALRMLVGERISGWTDPTFTNQDMLRGVLDEPLARAAYAKFAKVEVQEVGLIVRDDWGFEIGCSPDGLVGDEGGIEVKSRRAKKHVATIVADEVPAENMAQIQTSLLVTGRKWWDYVSYCGGLHLWVKRVYPEPDWQSAIIAAVADFERQAAEMVTKYQEAVVGLPMTERIDYDMDIQ